MRFYHSPPFQQEIAPSVAAIGNFDGGHLAHQQLINKLLAWAKALGVCSTVILFEPQPLEYFKGNAAPARLQSLSEKLCALDRLGVDQVVCLRFNAALAQMTPEVFIQTLVCQKLKILGLLVGEDFRFGYARSGDAGLLRKMAEAGVLQVQFLPIIQLGTERVSSTAIRAFLAKGDFTVVAERLGTPYQIAGKVIYGAQRGRLLGVPTANIALKGKSHPLHGVYAVEVRIPGCTQAFAGIANIGQKPTFGDALDWRLEVFLLTTLSLNLYGQRMIVIPKAKIRDEQKFDSLTALKRQIEADIVVARKLLSYSAHT